MLFLQEVGGMSNGRTFGYFNEFVRRKWSILTFRSSTYDFQEITTPPPRSKVKRIQDSVKAKKGNREK